jgi:hypothetical protein
VRRDLLVAARVDERPELVAAQHGAPALIGLPLVVALPVEIGLVGETGGKEAEKLAPAPLYLGFPTGRRECGLEPGGSALETVC